MQRLKAGREGNDGEAVGNVDYIPGNASRRQRRYNKNYEKNEKDEAWQLITWNIWTDAFMVAIVRQRRRWEYRRR